MDIDLRMVEGDVHISIGDDWTLVRESDSIGEIFCDGEYLFIEDYHINGYEAFAPLVGETGIRSRGSSLPDAMDNIDAAVDEYYNGPTEIQYAVEGTLAFDTPE